MKIVTHVVNAENENDSKLLLVRKNILFFNLLRLF